MILPAALGIATAPALAETAADAKKIADAIEGQWLAFYNAGNAAGIGGLFTPNGTYATPSGAVLNGPDAIEKAYAARIKAGWTKETMTVIDAHAAGTAAWVTGEYSLIGSGENNGKQLDGHFTLGLVQEGSAWKVRTLVANLAPAK
jgi:ketosteroid isomerase-like protein